jgi:hypothetical protein
VGSAALTASGNATKAIANTEAAHKFLHADIMLPFPRHRLFDRLFLIYRLKQT